MAVPVLRWSDEDVEEGEAAEAVEVAGEELSAMAADPVVDMDRFAALATAAFEIIMRVVENRCCCVHEKSAGVELTITRK